MKDLPFEIKIKKQIWDSDKEKYTEAEANKSYTQDIRTSDGIEFGGLSIRLSKTEKWEDELPKLLFETTASSEEITRSGMQPARLVSRFPNEPDPSCKSFIASVFDRDSFQKKMSDEEWKKTEADMTNQLKKTNYYSILFEGGLPTQLELYASSFDDHPERLVFEFTSPGIGEGVSQLN